MISHILVPIDFSACSINALHYAVQYAIKASNPVNISLLSTYTLPLEYSDMNISFGPSFDPVEIESRIKTEFTELLEQLPLLQKVKHETFTARNTVTEGIKHFCEEHKIDFIIMGTNGASGLDASVLGSNAHRVIQAGIAPVMMIPKNAQYHRIQNIAMTNDYKGITTEALEPVKTFSQLYDAKIHLIHISTKPLLDIEQSREAKNLERHLKMLPHQFHFILNKHVIEGIETFIQKEAIDLLVVIPRKKSLFEKLFKTSQSKPLIFHSKVPLLALVTT